MQPTELKEYYEQQKELVDSRRDLFFSNEPQHVLNEELLPTRTSYPSKISVRDNTTRYYYD